MTAQATNVKRTYKLGRTVARIAAREHSGVIPINLQRGNVRLLQEAEIELAHAAAHLLSGFLRLQAIRKREEKKVNATGTRTPKRKTQGPVAPGPLNES